MALTEIICPYTSSTGQVCRAHLIDIEVCTVEFVARCRNTHSDGKKRLIRFRQENGVIKYSQLPEGRRKYTTDVTVMISEDNEDASSANHSRKPTAH